MSPKTFLHIKASTHCQFFCLLRNPSFAWKQPELFGQQMRTHFDYQRLAFSSDRMEEKAAGAGGAASNGPETLLGQGLFPSRPAVRPALSSSANPLRSRLSASVSLGVDLLGRACSCHPYSRAGSAPGPGRLLPGLAQLLSEPALLGGGALCIATGRCRASGAAWRRRARGPWPGRAGDTRCSPLMDQAMGQIRTWRRL